MDRSSYMPAETFLWEEVNIFFDNGRVGFYHHDHTTEFILKNCPTPNRLITAVMSDLSEDVKSWQHNKF